MKHSYKTLFWLSIALFSAVAGASQEGSSFTVSVSLCTFEHPAYGFVKTEDAGLVTATLPGLN